LEEKQKPGPVSIQPDGCVLTLPKKTKNSDNTSRVAVVKNRGTRTQRGHQIGCAEKRMRLGKAIEKQHQGRQTGGKKASLL